MRHAVPVLIAAALMTACANTPTSPEYVVPLVSSDAKGDPLSSTHLKGEHEVPPRDTEAQDQAILKVNPDGRSITYKLIASNITNVIAAHIHIGPAGTNGGIAVFLFGTVAPGGGPVDGVLAEGTFDDGDFIGPLAGKTFADLLREMANGNAYVNVHTNDGVGATNTGPGDFPGGEIRGQIIKK